MKERPTRSAVSAPVARVRRRSYEPVAWCYDAIARTYSRGRIGHAKAWPIPLLEPGERVLYVGVGSGEDAVMAAERGARVTGVDLSQAMLRRAAARFEGAGVHAELIHGDFFDLERGEGYDTVVLNFFLSVFGSREMDRVLAHALGLIASGGRLFLADFAPLPPGPRRSLLPALYYWPVDWAGALLGLAALHAPHDSAPALARHGFEVVRRAEFTVWPGGSALYEALVAEPRAR